MGPLSSHSRNVRRTAQYSDRILSATECGGGSTVISVGTELVCNNLSKLSALRGRVTGHDEKSVALVEVRGIAVGNNAKQTGSAILRHVADSPFRAMWLPDGCRRRIRIDKGVGPSLVRRPWRSAGRGIDLHSPNPCNESGYKERHAHDFPQPALSAIANDRWSVISVGSPK
jgi:hypothetical protein